MCTAAEAQKRSNAMEAPTGGRLSTGWRDRRCLSGQVAFGLDLESERRFLQVENRKGAFLDEKGVPLAQGLRLYSGFVLENHNNSSAGSQVIKCAGSGRMFGNFRFSQLS